MPHAPKQVRDRGEGTRQRQVLRLEALAAPFRHVLAVVPLFVGRKENGNEPATLNCRRALLRQFRRMQNPSSSGILQKPSHRLMASQTSRFSRRQPDAVNALHAFKPEHRGSADLAHPGFNCEEAEGRRSSLLVHSR